jgi:hypothetical protein
MLTPILPIFLLLLLTACSTALNPEQYYAWFSGKDAPTASFQDTQYKISVHYKSPEFMALAELKGNELLNRKKFNETIENYKDRVHFHLNFEYADTTTKKQFFIKGSPDDETVKQRISYLNGGIQKDLQLIHGGDTIPCAFVQLEQSYSIRPYATVLAVFDISPDFKEKGIQLLLSSSVLQRPQIELLIDAGKLNQIPKLKL